ncbi:CBASS cGAMP-activated phospholipase [Paludisphaera soli]|uniref:CBASS cGAMP-activated phospholipase n=1 Tax=Paludisphaera soli TaxID=2712865 RepID=UPI0013ED6E48|nr:CBASS cGAMP-activated phospholipase [Paludisphaera soli]
MSKPFRILSIDGGGMMGAFPAAALAAFERATGRRVVDHFDLITGTSTGGIIAIGLAMGATAEQISAFYETEGPKIFPRRTGMQGWIGRAKDLFRPKYSNAGLRAAVEGVVGDRPLKEAKTRLVIPSYDVNTGKVYLFKTPHHENARANADLPALDAALATSAAPTFFPAHVIPGLGTFIDGGMWANCPAVVGLVEAMDFLGRAPEDVRMLSISTTNYPFLIDDPGKLRGLLGWAPKLVDTFMFGQAQSAVNTAFCLLKRGLFHRIDYVVPAQAYSMDAAAAARDVASRGRVIAELNENMRVVREQFLNGDPTEPYTPLA